MKVYLAGLITGAVKEQCTDWRRKIRNHYDNWLLNPNEHKHPLDTNEEKIKVVIKYPITWLDPLNSGEDVGLSPDGLKSNLPAGIIVAKDRLSVEKCDIVVANLDMFGHPRPLTGTLIELGWADALRKKIIVVTKDEYYLKHPFIEKLSDHIYESVDELIESKILNIFYKATVSAEY